MKNCNFFKILYLTIILIFCSNNKILAQSNFNIDSTWDNFYKNNPSGIENNFQASAFIDIIEKVNFIPQRKELDSNQQLLKRALLMLDSDDLRQMMITGNYYSRTYKHDDYFRLYNMTYNPISKDTWNRLCPYILPLMDIDGTATLR
jgi:hypothetical protein